jgi:hypothetical protein
LVGPYFDTWFPFLAVIPAGFSFLNTSKVKEKAIILSRCSKRNYYVSKTIAVFIVTLITFTIPLYIEAILNFVAFPVSAIGDPSNVDLFDYVYNEGIYDYLFSGIYVLNRYVYLMFYILLIGIFAGILAVFAALLSETFKFKYKIITLAPVYAILYLSSQLESVLNLKFSTKYFEYISMFDTNEKNEIAFIGFNIFIIILSCIMIYHLCKREEVN